MSAENSLERLGSVISVINNDITSCERLNNIRLGSFIPIANRLANTAGVQLVQSEVDGTVYIVASDATF